MNEVNRILAEDAFLIVELRRKYAPMEILVEAGVARIWHWINGGKPYGMLSAEKHDPTFIDTESKRLGIKSQEVNRRRSAQLSNELAKRKLGGILVRGYFREVTDIEPEPEIAFFVPLGGGHSGLDESGFRDFLLKLASHFNQESILYSSGGGNPAQLLLAPDGKVDRPFPRLKFNPNPDDLRDAWSEVRRHKFTFLECIIGADTVHDRGFDFRRGLLGGVHLSDLRKLWLKHPEVFGG